MQKQISRTHYDAYDRIAAFGVKYGHLFAPGTPAPQLFIAIDQVARDMERLGIHQLSASDSYHRGTAEKQLTTERVREELRAIRDTAVAIGLADGKPGFARSFLMPRSSSQTALLTRAKAVIEAIEPHVARFVQFELPTDFLANLIESVARLEAADDDQNSGLSNRVGRTAGLDNQVEKGLKLRRQLLAAVRNKFKSDAAVLAEWESASHIARVKRERTESAAQPAEQGR